MGVVGGVFILFKVFRVGFRHRVEAVPGVVPWQRWLSWSMLVLYSAVFVQRSLGTTTMLGTTMTRPAAVQSAVPASPASSSWNWYVAWVS